MKLEQLLTLTEETTSVSVARYNKPMEEAPILKRTSFMKYALDGECKGCDIIKNYAFKEPNSNKRELVCTFCNTTHKSKD